MGDGLRLGAINHHRQRLEGVDRLERIGKWLSGAQKLAVVVGNGEPKHNPDACLICCGQDRGRFGNGRDGFGEKAVHVLSLQLNQLPILLNGLL